MRRILSEGLDELHLQAASEALDAFEEYYSFLKERGSVMNLTAISGEPDTARLHFLDCAALLSLYPFEGKSVIDIGSGAGFPGIPIKLLCPSLRLTLLDSNGKKAFFLRELSSKLKMPDTKIVCARAEDSKPLYGAFDVSVSRAVARLNILCELCLPFVKPGGVFIAMKGPDPTAELEEAQSAISKLGGGRSEIKTYPVPGTDVLHSAVIIQKPRPTPPQYPRPFGKIKRSPL